jgi:hypothetical protein
VLIPLTFALSQIVWTCIELPIARFRQAHFGRHRPVGDPLVRAA